MMLIITTLKKNDFITVSLQEYKQLKINKMEETTNTTPKKEEKVKKPKKSEVVSVNVEEVVPVTDVVVQALVKHNVTEALLSELEVSANGLEIRDINDRENYDAVNKLRVAAKNTRVMTTKVCKAIREDSIAFQREVIRKEKEITDRLEKVEDSLAAKQKIVDDEKDKIKQEKERIELARLSDRTALLTGYGMIYNPEDSTYTLDDIKLSVVQLRNHDDFVFTTLASAVKAKFNEKEEARKFEEEQREIAAANAKRILEEQLAQAEVLKQKEAELVARQAAIEAAELKAKQEAEARIKQEQEAKLKAEQDKIAAEQKAKDEILKSRMSSLFSLGFSQQGSQLHFNGNYLSISLNIIQNHSEETWIIFLEEVTSKVQFRKEELENQRITELECVKQEAIAAEKKRQEDAAYADAIAAKEKEEELARIAAAKPDMEKFDHFLHQLNSLPIPEFGTDSYKQFSSYIKSTIESMTKHLKTKEPK